MSMTFDCATRSAARIAADPRSGAARKDKERVRNSRRSKYFIIHYPAVEARREQNIDNIPCKGGHPRIVRYPETDVDEWYLVATVDG